MNYRILFCLLAVCLMIGTVSADTLLAYAPSTNSDGWISRYSENESLTNMRNGVGTNADLTTSASAGVLTGLRTGYATNGYNESRRFGFCANTSSIPDTDTIDSAIMGVVFRVSYAGLHAGYQEQLMDFDPANPTLLTASDYNKTTFTALSLPVDGTTGTVYYNISYNAAGLTSINKEGYTCTYLTLSDDVSGYGGAWPVWHSAQMGGISLRDTSYLIATSRPFIEVTYTTGGAVAPVASFTLDKNFIRIPNTITATDTSTNTPTSWEWSWGDGSSNSTTQNPNHQYTKRGKWDIVMTATNAGGSSTTAPQPRIVTGYENYYN